MVSPDGFIEVANAAVANSHMITGVSSDLLVGTEGLLVHPTVTASIVLVNGVGTTLHAAQIEAPAACARGQACIQSLQLVQLGQSDFPLLWRPTTVACSIVVTSTCTLRARVFDRYLSAEQWLLSRANPREALRTLIRQTPTVGPDVVVGLLDFRRSEGLEEAVLRCTMRIKAEVASTVLASSGHAGLLLKEFPMAQSVEWSKPFPSEKPCSHLARLLQSVVG